MMVRDDGFAGAWYGNSRCRKISGRMRAALFVAAACAAAAICAGRFAEAENQEAESGTVVELRGRKVTVRHPERNTSTGMARAVRELLLREILDKSLIELPDRIETECLELLRARIGSAALAKVQQYGRRLVGALRAVVVDGRDPDQIYERRVRTVMTRETWRGWLHRYDSVQAVRGLEHRLDQDAAVLREKLEKRWRRDMRMYCLARRILDLVHAPVDPTTRRAILDRVWLTYCREAGVRVPGKVAFSIQQLGAFPYPRLPETVCATLDDAVTAGDVRVKLSPRLLSVLADEPGYRAPEKGHVPPRR